MSSPNDSIQNAVEYGTVAVNADTMGEHLRAADYYDKAAGVLERLSVRTANFPEALVAKAGEYRQRASALRKLGTLFL